MRILFPGWFMPLALLLLSRPGHAGITETWAFADSLLLERDYYRAITEYKRAYYLSPPTDLESRARAALGIGEALFQGEQYDRAALWFQARYRLLQHSGREERGRRLYFLSLVRIGDADEVAAAAEALPGEDTGFYRGLAWGLRQQWDEAATAFVGLSPASPLSARGRYNWRIAEEAREAGWRNPKLAGILGVVPGLGYLYAGHKQTALSALLVNGAFMFATYEAFRDDQHALGGFLALFSFSWYTGSIHGSVVAARRYNRSLNDSYVNRLLD